MSSKEYKLIFLVTIILSGTITSILLSNTWNLFKMVLAQSDEDAQTKSDKYIVRIAGLAVDDTRSQSADTVAVGLAARVGTDTPVKASKFLGDLEDGDHRDITLDVGPFTLDGRPLSFAFVVENNGGLTGLPPPKISNSAMSMLLSPSPRSIFPMSTFQSAEDYLKSKIGNLFVPGCNGIVAASKITLGSKIIEEQTSGPKKDSKNIPPDGHIIQAGGGRMGLSMPYFGTKAPIDCGSNSKYWVLWQIIKLPEDSSALTVPMSPRGLDVPLEGSRGENDGPAAIKAKSAELVEQGFPGKPQPDTLEPALTKNKDGYYQFFQKANEEYGEYGIWWNKETGAHVVFGVILPKWRELGFEYGELGYPVTDGQRVPGVDNAWYIGFQHGVIAVSPEREPEKFNSLSEAQEKLGQAVSQASDKYIVRIAGLVADETRSLDEDEIIVGLSARVGNDPPMTANKFLGDVEDHAQPPINLDVGPFTLSGRPLSFSFIVENQGGANAQTATKAGEAAAGLLLSSGVGSGVLAAYNILGKIAPGIFVPGACNGIVAADEKVFSSEEITAKTSGPVRDSGNLPPDGHIDQAGGGRMGSSKPYPGTDSATGCGSNSKYWVLWQIIKIPEDSLDPQDKRGTAVNLPPEELNNPLGGLFGK
jgi:hypothetical protein